MSSPESREGYLVFGRGGFSSLIKAGDTVLIGHSEGCDVRILADHVSGNHCEIWVDEQGCCFVQDLRSTNGTMVNGAKLAPLHATQISRGDIVDLQEGWAFLLVSFPLENVERYMQMKR
jgi:pSer/pThr/pTyr-binding forkhead associated (FHA) protein